MVRQERARRPFELDIDDMERHKVDLRLFLDKAKRRFIKAQMKDTYETILATMLRNEEEQDNNDSITIESVSQETLDRLTRFLESLIHKCNVENQHKMLQTTLRGILLESVRRSSLAASEANCFFCTQSLSPNVPMIKMQLGSQSKMMTEPEFEVNDMNNGMDNGVDMNAFDSLALRPSQETPDSTPAQSDIDEEFTSTQVVNQIMVQQQQQQPQQPQQPQPQPQVQANTFSQIVPGSESEDDEEIDVTTNDPDTRPVQIQIHPTGQVMNGQQETSDKNSNNNIKRLDSLGSTNSSYSSSSSSSSTISVGKLEIALDVSNANASRDLGISTPPLPVPSPPSLKPFDIIEGSGNSSKIHLLTNIKQEIVDRISSTPKAAPHPHPSPMNHITLNTSRNYHLYHPEQDESPLVKRQSKTNRLEGTVERIKFNIGATTTGQAQAPIQIPTSSSSLSTSINNHSYEEPPQLKAKLQLNRDQQQQQQQSLSESRSTKNHSDILIRKKETKRRRKL